MLHNEKPVILITPMARMKLDAYIRGAEGEISGLGQVEETAEGIKITDVYLFKQICTGSTTDLDVSALSDALEEVIKDGKDPGSFKLWWHSHHDMGTFWSEKDETTIRTFGPDNWMVSVVGNVKGEYRARIDFFKPIRYSFDELELRVAFQPEASLLRRIRSEMAAKVKFIKPKASKTKTPTVSGAVSSYGGPYEQQPLHAAVPSLLGDNGSAPADVPESEDSGEEIQDVGVYEVQVGGG